ncbi:Uma2 family endonuclease [Streptomyces sp. ST2-7A]|uniref:Uma2 family endonuclease n=1 Tax=Streptomyces sp. ST2-7A TaxID=2907214 RepID=UPI001F2DC697|nr:Uma2 family endonuclease [Streptomyces sp. ST2-7A]MCE7082069.1 Uma2 family endonuclease [Streptomyces sp. ST2-7A]
MTHAIGPAAPAHRDPGLDQVLWGAWKAMELPEGHRAEIVEGFIEVSPTGRYRHGRAVNRPHRALNDFLARTPGGTGWVAGNDMNVIHDLKVWIPDLFVAPEDDEPHITGDGIGLCASCLEPVVEVVSPGHESVSRDRIRRRRAYARAGIPVYPLIDDHDDGGTVTLPTSPSPGEAVYLEETRAPTALR